MFHGRSFTDDPGGMVIWAAAIATALTLAIVTAGEGDHASDLNKGDDLLQSAARPLHPHLLALLTHEVSRITFERYGMTNGAEAQSALHLTRPRLRCCLGCR